MVGERGVRLEAVVARGERARGGRVSHLTTSPAAGRRRKGAAEERGGVAGRRNTARRGWGRREVS